MRLRPEAGGDAAPVPKEPSTPGRRQGLPKVRRLGVTQRAPSHVCAPEVEPSSAYPSCGRVIEAHRGVGELYDLVPKALLHGGKCLANSPACCAHFHWIPRSNTRTTTVPTLQCKT